MRAAPEIIRNEPYAFSVDWFAFGCLVYEMIEGHGPWRRRRERVKREDVEHRVLYEQETYSNKFSESARTLCNAVRTPPTSSLCFLCIVHVQSVLSALLSMIVRPYSTSTCTLVHYALCTVYSSCCGRSRASGSAARTTTARARSGRTRGSSRSTGAASRPAWLSRSSCPTCASLPSPTDRTRPIRHLVSLSLFSFFFSLFSLLLSPACSSALYA